MTKVRAYHPFPLSAQSEQALSSDAFHHLIKVLRLKEGADITLFDGKNYEAHAVIQSITKKSALCRVETVTEVNREHPRELTLAQCLGKGEKMEWIIQKAVELGVHAFTPIVSERTVVKLSHERLAKKMASWQKVIIGASEQCGRNQLMRLNPALSLNAFLEKAENPTLFFHPAADKTLKNLALAKSSNLTLLIGPEGGFSEAEVALAQSLATPVQLGPRILRMETAALVGASLLLFTF
jgi:16S rRNA (uracil1498-N3)-methyltransferase